MPGGNKVAEKDSARLAGLVFMLLLGVSALPEPLAAKVQKTVRYLRDLWPRLEDKYRFVAFSTGKDSLAMAAMLYEAVAPERPVCLYSHHELEFPINLEYLERIADSRIRRESRQPVPGVF